MAVLQVCRLKKEEYKAADDELTQWETLAYNFSDDRLNSCTHISHLLADRLRKPRETDTFYVCQNESQEHQGYLCLEENPRKEFIRIAHLVTHPKNIPYFFNSNQIRGTGTALINYAEKRTLELAKKEIILFASSENSASFFKKLGYESPCKFPLNMKKTAEKIKIASSPLKTQKPLSCILL